MLVRQITEENEEKILSEHACLARFSRGRFKPEEPCELRTVFQRDRDRIIHCNAFRRLMHKTQVFLAPEGDHYRTRLTHTLEVAQIAKTLARAMRLNEDLTEAIALGHDLGHTPFGHAGERALSKVSPHPYKHYLQSVRVVQYLEKDGKGLNLTWEVLNGIACHTEGRWADTWEGKIVRYSDKIAYINHDIEDAIRAGVLQEGAIPFDCAYVLGRNKSQRITTLVRSIIEHSTDDVRMGEEVAAAFAKLRAFMFETVYTDPIAKSEEGKADYIITHLYEHFLKNPHKMGELYEQIAGHLGIERAVCDYISGMSDRFCVHMFNEIFVPKSWSVL